MKGILALVLSLIGAYIVATPIGQWFDANYVSGGFISIGPFPGYIDGFLFGYVFFASLIFPIITGNWKTGPYAVLPVLVLDIFLAAFDPQLWMDIILMAAGLALALIILFIKKQIKPV